MTTHGEILVYQTDDGELDAAATSEDFSIVRTEGTERLKEYLVEGVAMDDERLGNPPMTESRRRRLLH